ncbi:hypothetical protein AAC387_Pa03g1370 [Persea americana]
MSVLRGKGTLGKTRVVSESSSRDHHYSCHLQAGHRRIHHKTYSGLHSAHVRVGKDFGTDAGDVEGVVAVLIGAAPTCRSEMKMKPSFVVTRFRDEAFSLSLVLEVEKDRSW